MNARERVLTALAHQEPDRVPLALWGSYYTLQDQTYFDLLSHLGMDEPVPPFRRYKSRNSNFLDDRILDRLGTDIRYVWLGFTDPGGARPDTLQDAWGVQWARMGPNITPVGAPLANASIEQVADYAWPDPEQYIRKDELRDRLAMLRSTSKCAIAARAVNSYGPFEQASGLRGREQFLMDMIMQPDLALLLIDQVTDVIIRLNEIYLDIAGPYIDIMEIPGDDYAGVEHLLISPKVFQRMLAPALARIVQPIKQYRDDHCL